MTTVHVHPRTFTYRTSTEWIGRRNGRACSPGKESFLVSAPTEFRGDKELWSPEELFVNAVESCLMMTFAAMVEKYHLPVEAYYSEAAGDLEMSDGAFRFTRITIRPTIIITSRDAAAKTLEVMSHAEKDCLISNSVRAEVIVQPEVVLSASE